MRILIPLFSPPTGTWGSLTRVLAIGHAAKSAGHAVAFCAAGSLAERLRAVGFEVFGMPESTFLGLPRPLSNLIAKRGPNAALPIGPGRSLGSIWLVLFFSGTVGYGYLSRLVEEELRAVRTFQPDVLFTEFEPAAFLVSRITGIPIACTYGSIARVGVGSLPWRWLKASGNRILRAHGASPAEPQELILDRRTLKLIPSVPELEKDIPDGADYVFTGSLLSTFRTPSDAPFQPEPGKRYVFVYVGTGSLPLDRLREVLPKLFPEGSATWCLVGSQGISAEQRAGNVIFRPYWDAENLMPHCDWVVCHGGHNTIIQSLTNGVPLLVFPGPIFERRFNAQMVQQAGAGRFGESTDFNEPWLAQAMAQREACAAKAAELARRISALGGAETALQKMQALVEVPGT
jgi:UDP:flavonoid glycosyltransferase YjiC (YdhE family)